MIRPSRAGLGLGLTAALLFGAGRLLGLLEFYFLGAMAVLALTVTALYVLAGRLQLTTDRVATPARPRVGSPARVDLVVTNQAWRRTPVLSAHDPVQGRRGASVFVAPIKAGETTTLAYRLPTAKRGPVSIGPLEITTSDPLGLFRSVTRGAEHLEVAVLPSLLSLAPLAAAAGQNHDPESAARRSLTTSGEEFFALRPYVVGDELKRVDWRASARLDDLVVRQEEQPRSGRLTLLFDNHVDSYRSSSAFVAPDHDPAWSDNDNNPPRSQDDAFERAVTVVASFLHTAHRIGETTHFATGETSMTSVRTRPELDFVEDCLARLMPTASTPLSVLVEQTCRTSSGGTLVVVTGRIDAGAAAALAHARQRHDQVLAVSCVDGSDTGRADRFPVPTVLYARGDEFEPRWRAAVARATMRVSS